MTIATVGVTAAVTTRAMTSAMTFDRRESAHTAPNGEDGNSRFRQGP
ncbi:hypothetical protein [Streptomyces endophytica]|uniref:Uncharacterized protein n=1 Tax=Streptomyces endophytica TaxID=2991496 RepID=A0ABY6P8V0_9ACTN|nr:hypothetical protein [Streptomyces endophytica]UZJ29800.1 hypothetical protein OJ254_04295 [Streptomyces endophytica]